MSIALSNSQHFQTIMLQISIIQSVQFCNAISLFQSCEIDLLIRIITRFTFENKIQSCRHDNKIWNLLEILIRDIW